MTEEEEVEEDTVEVEEEVTTVDRVIAVGELGDKEKNRLMEKEDRKRGSIKGAVRDFAAFISPQS